MKQQIKCEDMTWQQWHTITGLQDENLKVMEEALNIQIMMRGDTLYLEGEQRQVTRMHDIFITMMSLVRKGIILSTQDIVYALHNNNNSQALQTLYEHPLAKSMGGISIYPKTQGQKQYIEALQNNEVVFGIGPAGTGKTYLAVVFAVAALKNKQVKKIILTRPAVEAGENLGFLPGDLKEKVDPYLRPLYDALYDMLGVEQTKRMLERGVLEVAPLAYMRGRTLEDAYVLLDEGQNTTDSQMKMFLTRLGFRSKMIITGDITQIDLPKGKLSGLTKAIRILNGVEGISFVHLSAQDVVRNPVVQRIIESYAKDDSN